MEVESKDDIPAKNRPAMAYDLDITLSLELTASFTPKL